MLKKQSRAIFWAFLAAVLYALNAPLSKLLLAKDAVGPTMLAGLLYVGAGLGMALTGFIQRKLGKNGREQKLEKMIFPT